MKSSATTSAPATSKIQDAAENCVVTSNVQDNGASISFDTVGEDDMTMSEDDVTGEDEMTGDGDDMASVGCVLGFLDTRQFVINHMDSTRALDGAQEDEWAGFKARWTYHPDDGLRLTVIDTKAASAL